jgi:hypothetical protein
MERNERAAECGQGSHAQDISVMDDRPLEGLNIRYVLLKKRDAVLIVDA